MFGRSTDRPNEPRERSNVQTLPPAGTREAAAVPIGGQQPQEYDSPRAADESLIGKDDHFEGKLRSKRGIRILGAVDGNVESAQYVHIDENAKVSADVTAEEVVIAGTYSGKLVCRQRLEIRATGRVSGSIETVKLMLHEGGYVDGELHMQKPNGGQGQAAPEPDRGRQASSPRSAVADTSREQASAGTANA